MRTAEATIKANRKVFNMFADDIYSDKPLAICRELVSNAVDSHTGAGIPEVPVQVWLPTDLDPMFRVKDQGVGMSEDFVFSNYLTYADGSTKDDSDEQIGGFGIGKASVFSYVDQFTLRSAHNGVLSIYTVYTSEDGIPTVGLMSQSPTSEANGVEVNFPVDQADFEKFHTAAQKGLMHFSPMPTIYGGTVTAPDYVASGKGWGMREKHGILNVVMGGVCYPVTTSNLDWDVRHDATVKSLFDFGLDITLPIGACGVALSRENLSYDTKTSEAIRNGLAKLVDEITASFATMFDHHKTEWEASKALNEEIGSGYGGRSQFLREKAVYKGQPLPAEYRIDCGSWVIDERRYKRGRYNDKLTAKWEYSDKTRVVPGGYEALLIDDLPQKSSSKTGVRIKTYVEDALQRTRSSLILRPRVFAGQTIDDIIKDLGDIPRSAYTLTSELDAPTVAKRAKNARPKIRMFTYNGYEPSGYSSGKNYNINPGRDGRTGVDELDYYDQPWEGILVVMENFEFPPILRRKVESGIISWDELFFVNRGDAAKLKGNDWTRFEKVFDDRLAAMIDEAPELPQRLALYHNSTLRDVFSMAKSLGNLKLTPAQQSRPFGKLVNLYNQYLAPLTSEQRMVAPFITAELPKRLDPEALLASFNTKQQRASRLASLLRHSVTAQEDRDFFMELI